MAKTVDLKSFNSLNVSIKGASVDVKGNLTLKGYASTDSSYAFPGKYTVDDFGNLYTGGRHVTAINAAHRIKTK